MYKYYICISSLIQVLCGATRTISSIHIDYKSRSDIYVCIRATTDMQFICPFDNSRSKYEWKTKDQNWHSIRYRLHTLHTHLILRLHAPLLWIVNELYIYTDIYRADVRYKVKFMRIAQIFNRDPLTSPERF